MSDTDNPWSKEDEDGSLWYAYPIELVCWNMVVQNDAGMAFAVRTLEDTFDGGIWVQGDPRQPDDDGEEATLRLIVGFPAGTNVWVAVCAHCRKPLVPSDDEGPGSCYDPDCFAARRSA